MKVLADMRAAGFKPRENTCVFLLKEAVGRGAFEEAFLTVRQMADGGLAPRLRSYAPILSGLFDQVRLLLPDAHSSSVRTDKASSEPWGCRSCLTMLDDTDMEAQKQD